ncbi:MAG: hypothetical protein ACE5HX_15410, partial [bacterium]
MKIFYVKLMQFLFLSCLVALISFPALAQNHHIFTLEESIDIALKKSFESARLDQSLINSRMSLKAAQASLKSNGELIFSRLPNFQETERQTPIIGGTFSFDRQKFMDLQTQIFINQPIKL